MHSSNRKNSLIGIVALGFASIGGCAGSEALAAGAMGDAFAAAAGIPQMDAFLPYTTQVAGTKELVIDGDWTISTLGKRIRIERGRAYALDPWTHAFTLKVRPNMVVMKNIRQVGATSFTGDDLPLVGPATMELMPDGRISVTVQGIPPYKYFLIPSEASVPERVAYSAEDNDESALNDNRSDCDDLGEDPETGEIVSFD